MANINEQDIKTFINENDEINHFDINTDEEDFFINKMALYINKYNDGIENNEKDSVDTQYQRINGLLNGFKFSPSEQENFLNTFKIKEPSHEKNNNEHNHETTETKIKTFIDEHNINFNDSKKLEENFITKVTQILNNYQEHLIDCYGYQNADITNAAFYLQQDYNDLDTELTLFNIKDENKTDFFKTFNVKPFKELNLDNEHTNEPNDRNDNNAHNDNDRNNSNNTYSRDGSNSNDVHNNVGTGLGNANNNNVHDNTGTGLGSVNNNNSQQYGSISAPDDFHRSGPMRKKMSHKDFASFSLVKNRCQDYGMDLDLKNTPYDPNNPSLGHVKGSIKIELDPQSKSKIESDEKELQEYDKDLGIDEKKLKRTLLVASYHLMEAAHKSGHAGRAYQDR